MSTTTTKGPQRILRRSPRQPTDASTQPMTQISDPQILTLPVPSSSPSKLDKRRGRPRKQSQIKPSQPSNQDSTSIPTTPPRAIFAKGESSAGTQGGSSVLTTGKNTRSKRKPNKPHASDADVSSTPALPKPNRSPLLIQPTISITPKKGNAPVQAYAGPTFHASPAPSALPIPKFFSKSAPTNKDGLGMKARMQEEASETSSSNCEDSPSMKNALRVGEEQLRGPSPLDVFFKADREEKAKRQLSNDLSDSKDINHRATESRRDIHKSPSPAPVLHHSRNGTGGSMNGLFSMDMDAPEKNFFSDGSFPLNTAPEAHRSESSPSIMTTHSTTSEEQARAKTQALKKLLLSNHFERPLSVSELSGSGYISSPSASPSPRPNALRSVSGSSTPTRGGSMTPNSVAHSQQHDVRMPCFQDSPAFNTRSKSRPLSSHLRQNLTASMLSEANELPSTPTPSRTINLNQSTTSHNTHNVKANGNILPLSTPVTKFRSEDALRVSLGPDHNSVAFMENELRRVLKLEVLGSGGATGVRS